jgi:hypothetical protein
LTLRWPAGKSLYQKYFGGTKDNRASRPQFMVAANGDPMQKLARTHLMRPMEFVGYVQETAAPRVRAPACLRRLEGVCT